MPSRWLLETASALSGSRVFASEFAALSAVAAVRSVPSFSAGIADGRHAVSLTEHDLGELAGFVSAGGDVTGHPLVAGSALATGVDAGRARRSNALTRWDGNVGTVREFPIQLPPMTEQRDVCGKLDALATETQRLARHYEQKQAALAAWKQPRLHDAFRGVL